MTIEQRYWDSDCFLGWLKGEPDKKDACRGVLEAAQEGSLRIVTSSLTLVEVLKLKGKEPVGKEDAERISDFFKNDFILVANLERRIAELARKLVWDHEFLKPKDAVHVATAMHHEVKIIDTFDKDLISLDGRIGNPPIRIGLPDILRQTELPFDRS